MVSMTRSVRSKKRSQGTETRIVVVGKILKTVLEKKIEDVGKSSRKSEKKPR